MKKTLITLLIFTALFNTASFSQSITTFNKKSLFISGSFYEDGVGIIEYYNLDDIEAYVNIRTTTHTRNTTANGKKVKRTTTESIYEIRLKNKTCLDVKYEVTYTLKKRTKGYEIIGLAGDTFTFHGIIKSNNDILIKKAYGRKYTALTNYKLIKVDAVNRYENIINDDNWKTDTAILNCLGYSSISKFQNYIKKKIDKKIHGVLENKRKEKEKKDKEIADKKKETDKWKIKGLDVHIAKYKKSHINGMYLEVPADSLEMIAKHLNLPLMVINTGAKKYKKGDFKLDEQSINFIKNKYVIGVYYHYNRSFWTWVRKNKYNIKQSPTVILLEIDKPVKAGTDFGYYFGNDFGYNFYDTVSKILTNLVKGKEKNYIKITDKNKPPKKKEKLTKEYYDNGNLKGKGETINEKKEGYWEYFYNNKYGSLKSYGNYENGKSEGKWTVLFTTGQIYTEGNYSNGKKDGEWIGYSSSNYLSNKVKYINGKKEGLFIAYHDNGGTFFTINYDNDIRNSELKMFHSNGVLEGIGEYSNGKKIGEWKEYYRNHQLWQIGNYKNGKEIGQWKFYHKNGQLNYLGQYENGNKTGEWEFFYENGELKEIKNF